MTLDSIQNIQTRNFPAELETREANTGEAPVIEGYFAVFGDTYDMGWGLTESIAPGAFDETLGADDIRALINHDTTLVLGRNTAHTLDLRADEHGLWASVAVNPNDSDAMNAYARVQRGDVSQCSIGFEILDESTEYREDDTIHWTLNKIKLYEVSVCTFPAYESTTVSARAKDAEAIRSRAMQAWKEGMKKRLKGAKD